MKRFFRPLVLLFCGCIAALVLLGSAGGRAFFSPDTLEYRSQSETLIRGTKLPIFRSLYAYHKHDLVEFLISKGYWEPREAESPRWILLFQWNHMWRDGESTLHRCLFWKKAHWMEWSTKYPERAAQLWPRVLDLLRSADEDKVAELLNEVEGRE